MAERIRISNEKPNSGPSGSTDNLTERETKFDEEGGGQAQAPSAHDVEQELDKVLSREDPRERGKERTSTKPKNTICLWFNKDAQEAARFYAATFPDSKVTAVRQAPSDYPGGKKGDVLTVEFTVCGIPCLGLNGGPEFRHSEAFSFQIATDDQEETDRYWNAIISNGGKESQCGWCKDRWGLSWQITPRVLTDALAAGGDEAKRAFEAMMPMKKIDIATIEAARRR
jgi:predicted 3-demethylubiquinone-9 3-methyltransferase (glyoxalase superfamily)